MKKLFSLITTLFCSLALITGCASAPSGVKQFDIDLKEIAKISKVEIYYHQPLYLLLDMGGSSVSGYAGMFGFFGAIAGVALEANSKLTYMERAEARTKEFNALLNDAQTPDINALQAQYIADLIRKTGREVKLIRIAKPLKDVSQMDVENPIEKTNSKEETARLILRMTPGYFAESATSAYKSKVVTEYVLRDHQGKRLAYRLLTKKDNGETYMTFDSLKSASKMAMESLNKDAITQADEIFSQTFGFPSLSK